MALVYASDDLRIGIAEQSTWGTAVADSGAFTELQVEPSIIEQKVNVREIPGSHATREDIYANLFTDTKGAMPEFGFKGPVSKLSLAQILYGLFQQVTEGASSPFSKSFTVPTTQADNSASAGKLHTVILRHQDASLSHKVSDAIVKKLVLSIKKGEHLQMAVDMVARGAVSKVSNPSGTWTIPTFTPYAFEDLARTSLNFGAGAQTLTLEEVEVPYENDIVPVGGASSLFTNYGIKKRMGTVKAKWLYIAAQFASMNANLIGNTAVTFNLGWGNATPGTVDGDLDLTITGKLTGVREVRGAGDLLLMETDIKILAASASSKGLTVTFADGVDKAW